MKREYHENRFVHAVSAGEKVSGGEPDAIFPQWKIIPNQTKRDSIYLLLSNHKWYKMRDDGKPEK